MCDIPFCDISCATCTTLTFAPVRWRMKETSHIPFVAKRRKGGKCETDFWSSKPPREDTVLSLAYSLNSAHCAGHWCGAWENVSSHVTRNARVVSPKPCKALSGLDVTSQNCSGSNEVKKDVLGGERSSMAAPVSAATRRATSPLRPRTSPIWFTEQSISKAGMVRAE